MIKMARGFFGAALPLVLLVSACGGGSEQSTGTGGGTTTTGSTTGTTSSTATTSSGTGGAPISVPAHLDLAGMAWPEDVTALGDRVYVSNFITGGIQVVDLADPSSGAKDFVPAPSTGNLKSFWGLRPVPAKSWILGIANINYAFDGKVSEPGVVRAYDAATGAEKKSWTLPDGTVGNSLDVDAAGNIYVGDVGPAARIVKIDAATDQVSVWKDSADWGAQSGFGLGGMVHDGSGALYVSSQGTLWRVAIGAGGAAGKAEKVSLVDGNGDAVAQVQSDGMSWAGNGTLFYAQNDAFQAGSNGVVFKVTLDTPTSGKQTVVKTGLTDPSGVFFAEVSGKPYLFVNESQFGYAFQVDQGSPKLPFQVLVIPSP
jgi:hypothetical protein